MNTAENLDSEISEDANAQASQYLTFMLAGEEYGVDILRVQEIKGWEEPTQLPNTPDYIQGVINIRGTIVPIICLRQRFDLKQVCFGPTTVVIVLKVKSEGKERIMGIVVDAVSDVYNLQVDQMKPPPDFGSVISIEFVQGLATVQDKMVIMLDIDKLMNSAELSIFDAYDK